MNNRFKFRVWDKEEKSWLNTKIWYNANSFFYLEQGEGGFVSWFRNEERFVCQQYTGLNDKNGQEIYEGDVLCLKSSIQSVVKFGNYYESEGMADHWAHLGYFLEATNYEHATAIADIDMKNVEIIGNIFENPELLSKQ